MAFAAVLLAVALVANLAEGQQGQKGKRGGFGFGFGGGQGLVTLAGNEAVQRELGLGESEIGKLRELREQYQAAMREEISSSGVDFQNLQNLSGEERQKMREKMTAATRKVNDTYEPKLKEILTADQYKRLKEISIQAAGAGALSDPAVAKELGLTEEQTKKIAAIREEYAEKQRGLFGQGGGQDAFARIRELREEEAKKVTEVLTPQQQEKFTALKGKPFDVAALRGGFGGPGGGKGRRPKQE
jgi:Spy/CpxP family protein refolding chaperone